MLGREDRVARRAIGAAVGHDAPRPFLGCMSLSLASRKKMRLPQGCLKSKSQAPHKGVVQADLVGWLL